MSTPEKRQALKAKIEAAEARNEARSVGEYAESAAKTATEFVREHPIKAIAGVAVIGILIGAMTKPGRQAGAAAGRRASALASTATELGLAYASGLIDAAGDAALAGRDKLEDVGDALNDNAGALKRRAGFMRGNAAAAAKTLSREAGKKAGRSVRDLKARIRN